jgi:hypothetical protein
VSGKRKLLRSRTAKQQDALSTATLDRKVIFDLRVPGWLGGKRTGEKMKHVIRGLARGFRWVGPHGNGISDFRNRPAGTERNTKKDGERRAAAALVS